MKMKERAEMLHAHHRARPQALRAAHPSTAQDSQQSAALGLLSLPADERLWGFRGRLIPSVQGMGKQN